MVDLAKRIAWLREECVSDDWDCDGAKGIPGERWDQVEEFLFILQQRCAACWVEPFVSPGSDSVHFSWSVGDRRLNMEIDSVEYYVSVRQGGPGMPYVNCSCDVVKALALVEGFLL